MDSLVYLLCPQAGGVFYSTRAIVRNITRFGRLAVSVGSSSWRAAPMCPEWSKLLGICIGNTRWMCSYTTCITLHNLAVCIQFGFGFIGIKRTWIWIGCNVHNVVTMSLWFSFPELEPLTTSFQDDKFPRSASVFFAHVFAISAARCSISIASSPSSVLGWARPSEFGCTLINCSKLSFSYHQFAKEGSACHVHWTAMMGMNDTAKRGKGWLDWSFHCTWWRQGGSTLPVTWSMRGILRCFASSNLWEDSSSAGWIHFWVVSGRAKFMPYSQCQRTCGCISEARDWCSMLFGRASNCLLVARSWR